jgi:predicted amidophosphoribosyltransferase
VPSLVRAWKERALRRVADLAVELVVDTLDRPAADVITYIPGDPGRQLTRAAHPAAALAHGLGEHWSLPSGRLLRRTRRVPRQTGLPVAERRRNVRGVFEADGGAFRGTPARVILVDDVYTTGATVSSAAGALLRAGAAEVRVITFARALR